jgi:predicted HTH transcriptional regulator
MLVSLRRILYKEYSKRNCVEIAIFKDHISFINHNWSSLPVTIGDLNAKTEFKDRDYLNDGLKEMFFWLDLIQSYGLGIRRAKNALQRIGSPALVFEPDSEMGDHAAVVAYINGGVRG